MKSLAKTTVAVLLASLVATAGIAQTIESKLEQMGKMSYVRVVGLKQVVRDGRILLQLELYNDDNRNQTVYWRTRWLDDSGIQVWDDEPWKQELVYSNQRRVLQVVAPTKNATDFRVELQSPENEGVGSSKPAGS
ncbi:MAG: DUF1425 domain-containing protein [Rhodocyclales bacterium]|nr:DUF1425 domain-containing protein [Rhodocyclales bacterium]